MIAGVAPATGVSTVGYEAACAILDSGGVWCWRLWPEEPAPVAGVVDAIALSGDHVIRTDGTVWSLDPFDLTAQQVAGLQGAVLLAAKVFHWPHHACVLLADGTVRCWGANNWGQLGDGTAEERTDPVQVIGLGGLTGDASVVGITVGEDHSCAWLSEGTAWCWGCNDDGQLGTWTTGDEPVPLPVQVIGL
jgi:alpha-tubulin suppressor-like RCC1 family protein